MIVASNQPYFAPYPGFFQKAALADVFVLLDTVQFPRGATWISRNRFKGPQGAFRLTVPVWKKGLGLQKIHEVRIAHEGAWEVKRVETLRHAYQNAPYFQDHMPVLEDALRKKHERLLDLNVSLITHVMDYLSLGARVVLLSELGIHATGDALLIEICKRLGGARYLAQGAAAKHLSQEAFSREGVELRLFRPSKPVYPQLWGDFVANLSIFDLLLNCGPKSLEIINSS